MSWFIEYYDDSALMIKVKETLFESKGIQHIQIFETAGFGKMLVLDGKIQLTERDESFYHEMLVHVPLFMVDEPKKILVIGGGDGGTVREVLKHNPDEVVMVEIDDTVINACRKYIGIDGGALEDERVTVLIEDGMEYVENCKERFDVVIVDGTDPNPVSESLVKEDFFNNCKRISNIFATQAQSPFIQKEYFIEIYKSIKKAFENYRIYINFVPTYPLGLWSYMIASKNEIEPDYDKIKQRWLERKISTKHYNPDLHVASFALPEWLKKEVKGD
ncbi:spermidine synthase [Archaeoglobus sulfaticallidus PM70-1]|uniref:Polyamine aminopropyltransferase n=1 Tax=Archaeoglobus sulfaticallidus PM70-1 TaxID=387631 RepID=N0BMS5_9EURY|nr:spermidine synthase [Archaeoglobus sulfaticallidus]AGK61555.1 spermidine synthase [Archaeoglobus sulfaticallidus PM70-1]